MGRRKADAPPRPGDPPKRRTQGGHRGFLVFNLAIEQVMHMVQNTWARPKLKEYPGGSKENGFIWPVKDDFDGAYKLIDAVLDKDTEYIREKMDMFPTYDMGLSDFVERVEKENKIDNSIIKTPLKENIINGHIVRIELETSKLDKSRRIVSSIYRGHRLMARKILAREGNHAARSSVTC